MVKFILCIFLLPGIFVPLHAQENKDSWKQLFGNAEGKNLISPGCFLVKLKETGNSVTFPYKGLQVLRQLSVNTYIVKAAVQPGGDFEYVIPSNANWKLSPLLLKELNGINNRPNVFQKFFLYAENISAVKKQLDSMQVRLLKIEYSFPGYIVISTTREKLISQVLILDKVLFVEAGDRKTAEETAIDGMDLTANKVNLVHNDFPLLNGKGVSLSLKEQKPDTTDIDFKGRYIPGELAASTISGHASIMATIAVGAGNSYYTGKGVAWGSHFTSSGFTTLLPDADADYKKYDITVQNHSYGTGIENYYGADAMAYDRTSVNNRFLLHIFSAGNSGLLPSSTGIYAGLPAYANITGSFKMSKNSISTGFTDAAGVISPNSSRGPAYDGRLKPELVAFGIDGSSGAAALVSGIALVCQQAFKEKNNGVYADAALIKAVLINSADDAGSKGIDYHSGFGRVNAFRAVKTIYEDRYFSGAVMANDLKRISFFLPSNAINLKITLAWTDPAASPNAYSSLVNDLDLTLVESATLQSWKPWVLSNYPHADSLKLLPVRKNDSINNVEMISMEDPAGGNYELQIKANNISGIQLFYIAYQWDTLNYFKWTFPSGKDHLLPGNNSLLRWETAINGTGELLYSPDGGKRWISVDKNINTTSYQYNWQPPDSIHTAMLKMVIAGQEFITDTFTVSRPLTLQVGFNCSDSLQLFWNDEYNNSYLLYRMGEKYLEPAGIYKDSIAVLKKIQPSSFYYAVAPLFANGLAGEKSYALNYTNQGVGCYVESFLADLTDNSARLQLWLGSLYNIQSIEFQKINGNIFSKLRIIQPVDQKRFIVYDSLLYSGINIYRVKIILSDGSIIYSEPESVFFFADHEIILYPNPVAVNGSLNILSKDPDNLMLRYYTIHGIKLLEKKLVNTQEKIQLPFSKGVYLVEMLKAGKRLAVTKLIVN